MPGALLLCPGRWLIIKWVFVVLVSDFLPGTIQLLALAELCSVCLLYWSLLSSFALLSWLKTLNRWEIELCSSPIARDGILIGLNLYSTYQLMPSTGYSFWDRLHIFYTNLHELFCQFISWTNWVDSGKFMDNCWISCQVMADMKKVYDELIIINL